jgi:hypothetical protein
MHTECCCGLLERVHWVDREGNGALLGIFVKAGARWKWLRIRLVLAMQVELLRSLATLLKLVSKYMYL